VRSDNLGPIVIDRSPPEHLSDHELRLWASDQKVFVSSVMRDMEAERGAVVAAVEAIGATPVLFERFGGRDDPAEVAYLDGVRGADIYVGVLGPRYGLPDASGYSPTHLEYNEAVHNGLRVSVWATTGEMDGRQRDFPWRNPRLPHHRQLPHARRPRRGCGSPLARDGGPGFQPVVQARPGAVPGPQVHRQRQRDRRGGGTPRRRRHRRLGTASTVVMGTLWRHARHMCGSNASRSCRWRHRGSDEGPGPQSARRDDA
jgi:hypothetical protein